MNVLSKKAPLSMNRGVRRERLAIVSSEQKVRTLKPLNPVGTRSTASAYFENEFGTRWNASLPNRLGSSEASARRPQVERFNVRKFFRGNLFLVAFTCMTLSWG